MYKLNKQLTHDEMIKIAKRKKPLLYSIYIGDSHPYDEGIQVCCAIGRRVNGIKINLKTREWEFDIDHDDGELFYTDLKEARDFVKKWAVYWQYNESKCVIGWNVSQKEINEQHKKLQKRLEEEKKNANNSDSANKRLN